VFHLTTHAFFKALLFLGAGSVIIAMHHEQDMRKMGGLKKYMPVTWITMWIGTLALIGFPGFAGFFSKDAIIEATHHSTIFGSSFAYFSVMAGVIITSFYSFRLLYMTFHGKPRMDDHAQKHLKESPLVVTVPLVLLAIPSVIVGAMYIEPMLFGDFFGNAIHVLPEHNVLLKLKEQWHGWPQFIGHGVKALPFYLMLAGWLGAWLCYMKYPHLPTVIAGKFAPVYRLLDNKYYIDEIYNSLFAGGSRLVGRLFWRLGDERLIDGLVVNGSARVVGWVSSLVRHVQSGYVYHYAFAMIIGLFVLITFYLHA